MNLSRLPSIGLMALKCNAQSSKEGVAWMRLRTTRPISPRPATIIADKSGSGTGVGIIRRGGFAGMAGVVNDEFGPLEIF